MLPAEPRKIIHLDMDAFYASVEQRDDPALRGRPVAVGSSRERGVVAAASYEARHYGVRSAMPAATARRLCPELIFVSPRFDIYKEVSGQIRAIMAEYTPLIEPVALDEAYLDVTHNLPGIPHATRIAREIRAKVLARTQLTASAGISYNKFLAKLASDQRKPNGQFVIPPGQGLAFVEKLAVGQFHGIGPVTAARLHALGIFTGADLRAQPEALLRQHFGKAGGHYHAIAHAEDHRPVQPDRLRKSVGAETTFAHDLHELPDLLAALLPVAAKVWAYCQRSGQSGRTLTLKVKYANFQQITRSRTQLTAMPDEAALLRLGQELLTAQFPLPQGVRLLGLSLSGLDAETAGPGGQLTLF
ncbi:DNA polymerase IV [Hymenobacter sp. BRD67]|nr:DNA polymerase IV [Hymenobacter sp. BRD67]